MLRLLIRVLRALLRLSVFVVQIGCVSYFCLRAYRIRLHAVKTYGKIIHEFDPWFNYRAAEYLAQHGLEKFFHWYDYMSWYPLGRPIGTTIYPGMQMTSIAIWEAMKLIPKTKVPYPEFIISKLPDYTLSYLPMAGKALRFGPMSVNDVCVMAPAWFGSIATFFVFLLSAELADSYSAGVLSAYFMAIIPAHIMRNYAGEYENEAFAISAFCAVLWLWSRSLRTKGSWPFGFLAGIAYVYAAATWGGYIFINNLIGLHAAVLVGLGKFNSSVHRAYSIYFIVGTFGATRVPVIGLAPLRSLEQMPSLLVFLGYQVLEFCDIYRRKTRDGMSGWRFFAFRGLVFGCIGTAAAAVAYNLLQHGYFMPLGARIRGLFLDPMKTGNPLVDSVAEHKATSPQAYETYLGTPRYIAALGLLFCWHQRTPAKYLAFLYAVVAYHYSMKMSRLVIICGPIVSVLAGFPLGIVADWCIEQAVCFFGGLSDAQQEGLSDQRSGGVGSIFRFLWRFLGRVLWPVEVRDVIQIKEAFRIRLWFLDRPLRLALAAAIMYAMYIYGKEPKIVFEKLCDDIAQSMSHPRIMFQGRDGRIIDDYYKGYIWLKENTPADSRVMAWWDYGYQITGVGNRTSIADGNTWNHEHIATLGRILTSNEKKSYKAMRHLADYALVWAGGRSDDMGKSPHLARIGNSVFPDHCGDDDPLCQKFAIYRDGTPTPMMEESFLYKAVNHNQKQGVRLNPKFWKEVHTTQYGLMRIFKVLNASKESKEWVDDPANRKCDAPGSWYCVGQYPPAIAPLIAKRRNFAQLEDFNMDGTRREKSAYTKLLEKQRGDVEL